MPLYPIKCGCGFAGDVFAKVGELDSGGQLWCPLCGTRAEQDYARKAIGVLRNELHGRRRESIEIAAKPHEVARLRRMYGDSGKCWQDDGSVRFTDKSDAAAFFRKEEEVKKRLREKKAARDAKAKGKV
ncbi:MAG: hypothetical protein IPK64_20730 [bacterium]|nr:hypothetical protein [bacterium]